ncbi:unnamed protein product [Caenorhabditis bovis]|uniref:Uncharacterized protein n=1 Tax=Caenorhabditis bovis TaxID=2654633 RepID=A0A8S1F3H4_9PELO|nr:unnamed protein product [Caenorhabditis bovis]
MKDRRKYEDPLCSRITSHFFKMLVMLYMMLGVQIALDCISTLGYEEIFSISFMANIISAFAVTLMTTAQNVFVFFAATQKFLKLFPALKFFIYEESSPISLLLRSADTSE